MKLVFPNGEHEQVELSDGVNLIGRGEDADVRLDVEGIADAHARITLSDAGASIAVDNAANITRVNGALVVARTPVSGGDALLFGTVQCQVVGPAPSTAGPEPAAREAKAPAFDGGETRVRAALPRFILRGVSGSTFGKHFPVYGSIVIGRQSDCDICLPSDEISRRHARVALTGEGLFVEDLDSANGTFVNDKRVRRERVEAGDELRFDTVRFLVQAPGQDGGRRGQGSQPVGREGDAAARPGSPVKWVAIAAVVVIAGIVGLKLLGAF